MPKKHEIHQPGGRLLRLSELQQYWTYAGQLEGLPTARWNKEQLDRLIDDHRDKPYPGPPYLIRPVEEPIDHLGGELYPHGTPSALPAVTCIGRYLSSPRAGQSFSDSSGLVVIWFQREFAFPIDPEVVVHLQGIDWDQHAIDLEF